MEKNERFKVDIPLAVSDFEDAIKKFELREKLYRIIFRGKALEFESYRDYTPDDDASVIDWRATKRSDRTLVKIYREERDLDILVVVDVSDSMVFGSTPKLKCEYAAEVIAALAHLIMSSHDKVGVLLYRERVVKFIPPLRGQNHFGFISDALTDAELYGGYARFDSAIDFLFDYPKRIDALIFVSDFANIEQDSTRQLLALSNRSESMALMIKDPLDREMPVLNEEVTIEDTFSGEQLLINPRIAREVYANAMKQREQIVRSIFQRAGIDLAELSTTNPFPLPLARFLEERVRRRGAFL